MAIARIKKNDTVVCIRGVDAGRTGVVTSVNPKDGTAVVKGLNMHKKCMRRDEKQAGGIIDIEMPIRLCKLMPYDETAKCGTRVRTEIRDGKKVRVSVKSGKIL